MPRISLNMKNVNAGLDRYKAKGATPEQIDAVVWLWGYLINELDGDHYRLGEMLDYHPNNLYKLFKGTYTGFLTNFTDAIMRLKKRVSFDVVHLVETCVTRRIKQALDYARDMRAMVVIEGETGRSKTKACQDWTRQNNHGRSIMIHCTSKITRTGLVRMVAKALGNGVSKTTGEIEDEIYKSLTPDKVLIFDEVNHALPDRKRTDTGPIEFLRDLHDVAGCSVVMIWTLTSWKTINDGWRKDFFEQLRGRIKYRLSIPRGKVFVDEVHAILKAYIGADPTPEMLKVATTIAKQDGKLRTLCADLMRAKKFAARVNEPLTPKLLVAARQWRESGGIWEDDVA